jgi:hypothetical protein
LDCPVQGLIHLEHESVSSFLEHKAYIEKRNLELKKVGRLVVEIKTATFGEATWGSGPLFHLQFDP